jgi:hypothetical protein
MMYCADVVVADLSFGSWMSGVCAHFVAGAVILAGIRAVSKSVVGPLVCMWAGKKDASDQQCHAVVIPTKFIVYTVSVCAVAAVTPVGSWSIGLLHRPVCIVFDVEGKLRVAH